MTNQDTMRLALERAIMLCQWIAETPHQRGSINGMAVQVEHELQAALSQQGEQPVIQASFEYEDAAIVGKTSAPIKRIDKEDDGSLTVVIDHWPSAPAAQPQKKWLDALDRLKWLVDNEPEKLTALGIVLE